MSATEEREQMAKTWENQIRDRVRARAAKLRRLADDLDREAERQSDVYRLVSTTQHTVAWGVANLDLSGDVDWLSQIAALRNVPISDGQDHADGSER